MVTARRQKLRPNRARERAKIARKMGTTKGDHGLLMKTTSMKRVRQLEREARRKIKSAMEQALANPSDPHAALSEDELNKLLSDRVRVTVQAHVLGMGLKRNQQGSRGSHAASKDFMPASVQEKTEKLVEEAKKIEYAFESTAKERLGDDENAAQNAME